MFDRCDEDTRAVVDTAQVEATNLGHNWLGTEHLLLALTIHTDYIPESVAHLLPSARQVRTALLHIVDRGAPMPNAQLLGTLGIDLGQVRAAVRGSFGDEALERLAHRRVHQPWQPWRRPTRACMSLLAGQQYVAPRVKQALQHAADYTTSRQQTSISPAVLLLGIVEVEDALANRLLRDLGVAPDHLRTAVDLAAS